MNKELETFCISTLKSELIPALGCTEPIAVAYAAAKARAVLGEYPERIEVECSGNIIKNVKGVMVPNSGGLRGVDVAAILGVIGGNAESALEVLTPVSDTHRAECRKLLEAGYSRTTLKEGVANLYVKACVFSKEHRASVTIVDKHTNITEIVKDGQVLSSVDTALSGGGLSGDWPLNIEVIKEFADSVDIDLVKDVLLQQVEMNTAISRAGMEEKWGQQVGKTLLESYGDSVRTRARAKAAAGSDARMAGCSLPVVINSGSGNQGITVCLPVVEYAKEWGRSEEELLRALCVSNLCSVHCKHFIGSLSAFCGAVTAGAAAGAGICYLDGGDAKMIGNTIINALGNDAGIVCDGAKSSCAAKIASGVEAGILGWQMAKAGRVFENGEGLVMEDVESTIRSFGRMGRVGMKETDIEILKMMIGEVKA